MRTGAKFLRNEAIIKTESDEPTLVSSIDPLIAGIGIGFVLAIGLIVGAALGGPKFVAPFISAFVVSFVIGLAGGRR